MPGIRFRRMRLLGASGGIVPFDPAQIYFDAVVANGGALSDTEKDGYTVYRNDAIDNADAWNDDCHIDLPMIGGTVESMVVNAQNPGTFDAIAVNTVAGDFTANGFTPNGTDSYFRMILIPADILTIQSVALEYYSRLSTTTNAIDMGVTTAASQQLNMYIRFSNSAFWDCYDISGGRIVVGNLNSQGSFMFSRIASNDTKQYKNGSETNSGTDSGGTQPTHEVYLGCRNNVGVASDFSDREVAGAGIYDGLIPAKVLAQYNARQTLNATLSRNI